MFSVYCVKKQLYDFVFYVTKNQNLISSYMNFTYNVPTHDRIISI